NVTRGFGLRVTARLARSWVLNYTTRGGRERRYTIGSYPDWPCALARAEAQRLHRLIDVGQDPMEDRRQQRSAPTVGDLIDAYVEQHLPKKRASSAAEDRGLLSQWVISEFGQRKVGEIKRTDVERLHRQISTRTPTRANRVLALLSTLFSLAQRLEWRADNPCRGVGKNPEHGRERYLSGDETRRLVEVLATFPDRRAVAAVSLLMLTGSRRKEVLGAQWTEFDFERGIWTKPHVHTKGKLDHRVPLSAPTLAVLATIPREGAYLFPARQGVHRGSHIVQIDHAWRAIRTQAGLEGVRCHDLRHSFASELVSAGFGLPAIGKLLGHRQLSTTEKYAHLYDDVLRSAVDRVGATVVGAKPAAADDEVT